MKKVTLAVLGQIPIRLNTMTGEMIRATNSERDHWLKGQTVRLAPGVIQMMTVRNFTVRTEFYSNLAEESEEDMSAASSRKNDD